MLIEIWGQKQVISGIFPLLQSWQQVQTAPFEVRFVEPDKKYIKSLNSLHPFVRQWRTVIKVNGKHVFFDGTERRGLASESHLLPFDLIVKCQYSPGFYKKAIAPVSPFVYTLNSYDMAWINKHREIRRECMKNRKFTSSIFWAGSFFTSKAQRWAAYNALKEKTKLSSYRKKSLTDFYDGIARTQMGLVVAGGGDFTHRELELESIGTPYFRKTYNLQTYNPRIPNLHYYTIGGDEVGIDKTMNHFIDYFEPNGQYRNFTNEEWDQYCSISENSLKWFETNGSPQGSFNNFVEILQKHSII